ncbi:alpha/beta fold hydrolase [Rhizobium alvei]|uniref:Alpha/beta fold hydrolase n=1 Tax=Rhizobium alvei TaxID=1132659 RepID=A0ABT8YI72_9HYPH|nr:alpha/beta fold hydrolase [Rhizobium alvei]MDO6963348.1 alpha/beta fold hydrolase [Rhizobium alvei]
MADPVLLIHGAWQGSWTWKRFVPLLESRGLTAIAVDLPGIGYDDVPAHAVDLDLYLDHIGKILDGIEGKVSVVGHSGGGVVATAVAERFFERVSRIAYIAGMMLPAGMGFKTLQDSVAAEGGIGGITPHLLWSSDRSTCWAEADVARAIFYHDCTPEVAEDAVGRLRPQPFGGFALTAQPTPARFGRLPRLYIEAALDRSVGIVEQRRMQALVPGAANVTLETGHVPQLSAPEALAEALIPFLVQDVKAAA